MGELERENKCLGWGERETKANIGEVRKEFFFLLLGGGDVNSRVGGNPPPPPHNPPNASQPQALRSRSLAGEGLRRRQPQAQGFVRVVAAVVQREGSGEGWREERWWGPRAVGDVSATVVEEGLAAGTCRHT